MKRTSSTYIPTRKNRNLPLSVTFEAGEFNRLSRLMGAYNRLECEAQDLLEKYGDLMQATGLKSALTTVSQRRLEYGASIVERYGLSDRGVTGVEN